MSQVWEWLIPDPRLVFGCQPRGQRFEVHDCSSHQIEAYHRFMALMPCDCIQDVNFTFEKGSIVFKVKPFIDDSHPRFCVLRNDAKKYELIMSDSLQQLQQYVQAFWARKAAEFERDESVVLLASEKCAGHAAWIGSTE